MSRFKSRRIVLVSLAVLALLVCGCTSALKMGDGRAQGSSSMAEPDEERTTHSTLDPDTLLVYSFPTNVEVFVTPKEKLTGSGIDVIYLTSKDYLAGRTPLEIELEPGEYRVTVNNPDDPIDFRPDNEASVIQTLTENGLEWTGKSYAVTKRAEHAAIVSAPFWPAGQSLEEFVASLPDEILFDIPDAAEFERILRDHDVPEGDWESLAAMLQRTGKAVWHGQDRADDVVVYLAELDSLAVFTPPEP